jgi:hypothetical protein
MERQLVDSSMILAVSYDPHEELLELELHDGSIYHYYRVPECIVEALLEAESKGKFFNFLIRGAFDYRRMRDVGGRRTVSSPRTAA